MTDRPVVIPHLAFPFQWGRAGGAVQLEQDTDEEITNCVELITSVTVGGLQDQPDFGITDPTFTLRPDPVALQHQIEQWEPRAKIGVAFSQSGDGSELDVEINVKTGSAHA